MTENFFTVKFRITPNLEKYLHKHGINWREEKENENLATKNGIGKG
jgi:hypothetical protein